MNAKKSLLKFNQKYREDLKDMKEKEKAQGVNSSRIRWFNNEIQEIENQINSLVDEVA